MISATVDIVVAAIPHSRALAVLASAEPCVVPRDDLLRLLTVAGLFDTQVYHAVAGSPEDPVVVDQMGLLKAIEWARESSHT